MAADFIPLADYIRPRPPRPSSPPSEDDAPRADNVIPWPGRAPANDAVPEREPAACGEIAPAHAEAALRDARLFRARLADAFDDAAARMLRELAARVLVRELRLAPCELGRLVAEVRERAPAVRVRLSPRDAQRLCAIGEAPVVADGDLDDGDAIVELAGGALDVRLGVRLASVLEAFA